MRVVNLTHGSGNGVDKACLMTAANMLIGKPKEGDNCGCVCPVIRAFIITTNDEMPEPLLSELYGPLVWEILGTKSTPEVELQRAYLSADFAVRTLVPIVLDNYGAVTEAESLRALPAIVDQQSARAAYAANAAAVWSLCRDHIRAMVAIGDTRPVETVISHDVLCDRLEGAVR